MDRAAARSQGSNQGNNNRVLRVVRVLGAVRADDMANAIGFSILFIFLTVDILCVAVCCGVVLVLA